MSSHTPGSWSIGGKKPLHTIRSGQDSLALVYGHLGSPVTMHRDGEGEANARLIAASPEMLSQLKESADFIASLHDEFGGYQYERLRDALVGQENNIRNLILKATQP